MQAYIATSLCLCIATIVSDEGSVTSGHGLDGGIDMVGHVAPSQPDYCPHKSLGHPSLPNATVRYVLDTYLLEYLKNV